MRRQVHNLILVIGCSLILFGFAAHAEAGFIVASLDAVEIDKAAFVENGTASSSSKPEDQQPQVPHQLHDCITPAGLNGAGNMSSQTVTSQGGSPPFAISPVTPVPTSGELTLRLSQQREPYHPRFIKSRLFRPPRIIDEI